MARCGSEHTRLTIAGSPGSGSVPPHPREAAMKRNLLNFTRGSQLLGHFGFMFAAGLKGPLLVTFIVAAWLSYWEVTTALTDHQIYLAWMHLYASGYAFMEFDPGKLVELKLAGGGIVRLPF